MTLIAAEAAGLQHEHVPHGQRVKLFAFVLVDGAVPDGEYEYPAATCALADDTPIDAVRDDDGNMYTVVVDLAGKDLGTYTATWSFAADVADYTHTVEVVGARVASLADLNASLNKSGDAEDYDELLPESRRIALQQAVEAFEEEAGFAFTRRQITEKVGTRDGALRLTKAKVVEVLEVRDANDNVVPIGTSRFGRGPYTVTYTYGLDRPPAYVSRAVALIASSTLADGPWDDRGYAVTDEGGTMRMLTAGVSGAAFSIPDVQAALYRVEDRFFVA